MINKILVIDDEEEIRNLIEKYLKKEGYEIIKASNGKEALKILEKEDIDMIILDIMIPKMNEVEFCKRVRKKFNIPILMLSDKPADMYKILGLMSEVDDYITKPFNLLELLTRLKAIIKRTYYFNNMNTSKSIINIENLIIYKNERIITIDGMEVPFYPIEFDILYLLASNKGKVFSSKEIFLRVWKEDYSKSYSTVTVHISRIREKLLNYSNRLNIIKTVWGVGYKIEYQEN